MSRFFLKTMSIAHWTCCTMFENYSKCRILILAVATKLCPIKTDQSGKTQNVNEDLFARNVEWDFFCDFQTQCQATDREKALLAPYSFLNTSFATKKLSFHIIIYLDPIFQATNDFRELAKQKNALFFQLRYFFEKRSHQWVYLCELWNLDVGKW